MAEGNRIWDGEASLPSPPEYRGKRFVGLTVYDTQKLKQLSYQVEGNAALSAWMSVVGSLVLYLDFINLSLFMLRIMGGSRRG